MTRAKDPSQAELAEVFEIRDGELWRKEYVDTYGRIQGGLIKNVANTKGYCRVGFKGRLIYYHRIVRILLQGHIEDGKVIDHADGDKVNNDFSNLIPKDLRGNNQNRRKHREEKPPGITWNKQAGKWRAQITVDGKNKHLGYFDTALEAFDAYIQANRDYGFPVEHLLEMRAEYIERNRA